MQTTLDNWRRNSLITKRDLQGAQLAEVYDLRINHGAQARKQNPSTVSVDLRFMPPHSLNEMLRREAREKEAVSHMEPTKLVSQHARDLRELVAQMSPDSNDKRPKKQIAERTPPKESAIKKASNDPAPRPAFAGFGTRGRKRNQKPSATGFVSCPSLHAAQMSVGEDGSKTLLPRQGRRGSPTQQSPVRRSQSELMGQPLKMVDDLNASAGWGDEETYATDLLARVCDQKPKQEKTHAHQESPREEAELVPQDDSMSKRMRGILHLREEIAVAWSIAAIGHEEAAAQAVEDSQRFQP